MPWWGWILVFVFVVMPLLWFAYFVVVGKSITDRAGMFP